MDVAASKSRGMDATSFAVASIDIMWAEHLENLRFVIRSRYNLIVQFHVYNLLYISNYL